MLIKAGPKGVKQMKITEKTNRKVKAAECVAYLEHLQSQRKVDKFIKSNFGTSNHGTDTTIWRATDRIRET
jgi:hypothetical protein